MFVNESILHTMFCNKIFHSLSALFITLCFGLFVSPCLSWGETPDESLELYSGFEQPHATSYRLPRPTSKIAENVSVITAADIERLNAHTLVEVLETVPGFHFDQIQTPGAFAFFTLQGTASRHVLVQMDGVPQNFISSDNIAELGAIAVQRIERVEIIKGAASAAWGSALGGVVNIITKSPNPDRNVSGSVSGSIGSRTTADTRGEISGTVDRLGYYLTVGDLRSDGLTPGTQTRLGHGFGKLTYDLPSKGSFTLGLDLRDNTIGLEDSVVYDFHDSNATRYISGYLNFRYPLADRLNLNLNGYVGQRTMETKWGALTTPDLFKDFTGREFYNGVKGDVTWGDAANGVTVGAEYEHHDIQQRDNAFLDPVANFDTSLNRWSGHINGIWTIGQLSLLPGFRVDHTNLLDDAYSYTLGATYQLADNTTLRAYAARGYSMPLISNLAILNGQRSNQNITTVQAGFETTAIPYLWLKGTFFYNNIWNIQSFDTSTIPATVTLHDQIRQGFEVELRTSPIYGLSLTSGFTFTESWDKATKTELTSSESGPRQNLKLGVNYDNVDLGLQGALTGNYVLWNAEKNLNPNLSGTIWDLHLNWKPLQKKAISPEFFFSIHNIFNGDQYIADFIKNSPRWFEGGMRVRF